MKCGEVTIWHGNKGKGEKDTAVSFFVCPDSRSFIFLALVKLAGSTKVSPSVFWITDKSDYGKQLF